MKIYSLSIVFALALGGLWMKPVYSESGQSNKQQRYEQRREMGKPDRQRHQQKDYSRQHKKDFRSYTKTPGSKQRKQGFNRPEKNDHQYERHDRRFSTERGHLRRDYRKDRYPESRHVYQGQRRDKRRYEVRHGRHLWLDTPRHRRFHHILIVRPHGHAYHGYGHFLHDHDAWRWLTFTAITLKLLDMVDEQAQREHEAAQVAATMAPVGEEIIWDTGDASGYVVTTREGANRQGQPCREYQHSITVGGQTEKAYGTACQQADGSWKIVN